MGTKGFTRFKNKLKRAGRKLDRAETDVPRRASSVAIGNIKRQLIESDLIATTELWRSVTKRRVDDNVYHVLVTAPYAGYVERGTGAKGDGTYKAPSFVPMVVILEWMQAKPTFVVESDRSPEVVAQIIAMEIEEKGQRQQPFFEPVWDDLEGYVKTELEARLHTAL